MKKVLVLILALMLALPVCGCAEQTKKFDISGAAKITIGSGSTGKRIEITDEEAIRYITENINAITFGRDKSSKNSNGFAYGLTWYDSAGEAIDGLIIHSAYKISYENYFYNGMEVDHGIDIEFIKGLFEGS